MKFFAQTALAVGVTAFAMSSQAALIEFNFSNDTDSFGSEYSFTSGGVSLDVSGYQLGGDGVTYEDRYVFQSGIGIGVGDTESMLAPENYLVDGYDGSEMLSFTFSEEVDLSSVSFTWFNVAEKGDSALVESETEAEIITQSGFDLLSLLSGDITKEFAISIVDLQSLFISAPTGSDDFAVLGLSVLTADNVQAVSEPTTLALFGLGIAGLGMARRRTNKS